MGLGRVKGAAIPAWSYAGKVPSIYTLVESIALAGLEGQYIRLSAADQQVTLGYAVFGRRVIKVQGDGTVECVVDAGFGRDQDSASWPAATVQAAATARKQLRPGTSGPGYFCPPEGQI